MGVTTLPLLAQNHSYTGMVAFEDSLSDGGNLNSLLGGLLPENEVQNLTGWDPHHYYNYRFSNGPVWVDYLYTGLGFGPIGAMGANDVFASVEKADPITPAQVVGNLSIAITSLYAEGGRFFVVPNLPPIGLIPSYIADPIKGPKATAFVDSYNDLLDTELAALSGNLEDLHIFKVDIHGLFLAIMANPEEYGFTNVTDTAYIRYGEAPYPVRDPPYGKLAPNSEGYFYWDVAHGTSAANALIAQEAYLAVIPERRLGYISSWPG